MSILRLSVILCSISVSALAQDGGRLFTLNCSACHGADGKGAAGGAFPALAGSPWVAGDPDRAIKIVLMGLHGPVTVLGKSYNLEMPPQGAAISDENIAAILTYVRSSWGNKESAVHVELVKKIRAGLSSRTESWTSAEILKLHPLNEKPPLENLISSIYNGKWETLPDFTKMKATAVEEEHAGLISLAKITKKGNFGVVWEGDLAVPAEAEYQFRLEADDGGRLFVAGNKIAETIGTGPAKARGKVGSIKLLAGSRKIRLEYFEVKGKREIHLLWRKKGAPDWIPLSDESGAEAKMWPAIILAPHNNRPVIYRNFIAGITPRAIGVGFPGGVNLAYSGDNLAPELIWTGRFIDAGHHWTDRGIGNEPPAGTRVVKLTGGPVYPAGARFDGYDLDPAGNPVFAVQAGGLRILDSFTPSDPATLVRVVKVSGDAGSAATLILSEGMPVTAAGADTFDLGGKITIHAKSARMKDGKTLVLPLVPGSTEIHYTWK